MEPTSEQHSKIGWFRSPLSRIGNTRRQSLTHLTTTPDEAAEGVTVTSGAGECDLQPGSILSRDQRIEDLDRATVVHIAAEPLLGIRRDDADRYLGGNQRVDDVWTVAIETAVSTDSVTDKRVINLKGC